MDAKGVMNSDLETIEEKLQILRAKMSEEEYETIRREIDEIRKLGLDLPDNGYMANVTDIIKRLVALEVDSFSDKEFKKAIKEVKKEGFLAKLEYIKLCAREGKDVSQIFSVVGQYWNAIKETFDAFEVSEIERKLEEVKLEILLKKVQISKEVKLNETEEVNYLLIRERLQDLLANETISQENKLLIKSWIGESIDAETGKVDAEFIKKLLVNKEIWEVLSGVKGVEVKTNQERQTSQTNEKAQESKQTQALIALGESKRRAEQIAKLSKKYNIPLKEFDLNKKWYDYAVDIERYENEYALYVMRYERFGKTRYKVVKEYEATKIRNKKDKKAIVAVVFNNHVTEILEGGHANQLCLTDVVFPDALQKIGQKAFRCTGLKEITIPETVEEIGEDAFLLTNLEKIDIPGNVKKIGDGAFAYNRQLKEVILREGLEEIGSGAFLETALEKIDIPGSVKNIANWAFAKNTLEEVNFREGVEKIGYRAFYDTKLRKVIFPQTIKIIGSEAFCASPIDSVSIPRGVDYAKEIIFPEGIHIIKGGIKEENITLEEVESSKIENEELRKENDELRKKVDILEKKIAEFEKLVKGMHNERESQSVEK